MIRKLEILISAIVLFLSCLLVVSHGHRPFLSDRLDRPGVEKSNRSNPAGEAESDWFIVQRAFPANDIPRSALPAMTAGMKQFNARWFKNRSSMVNSDWTLAGPSNVGGRITALALDPTNENIIYAAAASGGVWKSTDLGTTWTNIFNESFSIGALALSPGNPNVVYVGTGEANPSSVDTYPGNGIWRSTDAGNTWTNLGLSETGHIGKISVNPLNPNTIFVSTLGLYRSKTIDRGIYRSVDYGATWNKVLFVDDTTGTADIEFCPSDTTILLASSWTYYRTLPFVDRGGPSSGVYRSTDGGSNWTHLTNGIPHDDPAVGRISLAFAPSNTAIVYALVANGDGYNWGGVYKSTDFGVTWTESFANTVYTETQVWYNNIITVHPTNENLVWAGMTTLYQSTDGGTTFHPATVNGAYHVDHHALEYSQNDLNTIVLGNDGGVYISTDGGTNWTKSLNLPITQYYAGTVSYLNPNRLMGGTQDNGSSETYDGTDPWWFFYGGDGFYCLIDPTDSEYIYAETQYGGMAFSTDGGNSFHSGTNGLDGSEFMGWETPIVLDPKHPKTLYTGFESVYRTKNNMQSWTKISGNLTQHISSAYSTVSTIDVSPVDSNVIYAGTGDGKVWVTTDGGGLWTDISSGLPLHWVTRVVADPESSNVAYVTMSGFREYDPVAHVFVTSNFGATWTNIGTSLPDIPVNDLIVDPENRAHLFIATDMNVMFTSDRGLNWSILGSSLPVVTVHDLAFNPVARELVAFTHGRSVYTIQVAGPDFVSRTLTLNQQWNLVSNPLRVQNDSVTAIFPSTTGSAFGYDPLTGYVVSQSIVPGRGYWVRNNSGSSQTSQIFGDIVTSESVAVAAGWNLIGSLSSVISKSDIAPVGTAIISNIFGYTNGYFPQDSLNPGSGYWVKVDQPGMVILQTQSRSNKTAVRNIFGTLDRYNKLMFKDSHGNRGTLYFGDRVKNEGEADFEMPPVPLDGLFDVRFATNAFVAISSDHAGKFVPIRLVSSSYPISLTWVVGQSLTPVMLQMDGNEIPLIKNGTVSVPGNVNTLGIKFSNPVEGPSFYALFQNYPNPFNPSTEIAYSLPEQSYVRLLIFNSMGQLITTLVEGIQDEGFRSVHWNGVDRKGLQVATGVYICRMESQPIRSSAHSFVDTKKMVLVR
jgi:photosystem II stability/assembly factor-like uncharacterized protein